ncbi:hypothetical protein RB594_004947 [Gaeumannomyces avenae]
MALSGFAWPAFWLSLWLFLSFLSLRQREKLPRHVLAVLHVAAVAIGILGADIEVLRKLPSLSVHMTVWGTVHTASILFLSPQMTTAGLSLAEQFKATVQIWLYNRYQVDMLIVYWFEQNGIGIANFLPENQGLMPEPMRADVVLRAIMSVHWMWCTQYGLTAARRLCAALFVSVLGWDPPEAWTSPRTLFGSPLDAYTLRRFWAVYWHRLHVAPFSACAPPRLPGRLRARWFFVLSAGCHAVVNRALCGEWCVLSELRFVGTNWAVCCLETALGLGGLDGAAAKPGGAGVSLRSPLGNNTMPDTTKEPAPTAAATGEPTDTSSSPSYNEASQPGQDIIPPTKLVLDGQQIR